MPIVTNIPVNGVWFSGINQLNKWLNEQHPLTAQAMSKNVVEAHVSTPQEGAQVSYYLVMTGMAGYVNAYTGISQRQDSQLVFFLC